MYAVVIQVRLGPGARDEGSAIWREKMLPELRKEPGFREAVVLFHHSGERGMSVIWESEEACSAAEDTGLGDRLLGHVQDIFTAPPGHDRYVVLLQLEA